MNFMIVLLASDSAPGLRLWRSARTDYTSASDRVLFFPRFHGHGRQRATYGLWSRLMNTRKTANEQRAREEWLKKKHVEIGDVCLRFGTLRFKPQQIQPTRPPRHIMGEFDSTLGALCVAYALAWGLFGIQSMQSFNYFQKFVDDTVWLKSLVAFLWVLDTLQLVFIGHLLYFWVITNYTNPAILSFDIWSLNVGVFVTNFTVFIVQLYLARRVFILSNRNAFLTGIIILLSLNYFGFDIAVQVKTPQLKGLVLSPHRDDVKRITSVALASASVADMLIALSLSYYLRKSRTGIKTTDSLVNKLILYAMSTGLLTGICVLIDMICFLAMPGNLVHVAFNIVSGELYTNSLLASLNFREVIRRNNNLVSLSNINPGGTALQFRATTEPNLSVDRSLDTSSNAAGAVSSKSFNGMKFSE
ncbi:hypothetical protein R3P38DRAFT_3363535, partial [Favolaschia claudopus]